MCSGPFALSDCIFPLVLKTKSIVITSLCFPDPPLLCFIVFFKIVINASAMFFRLYFPSCPIFGACSIYAQFCQWDPPSDRSLRKDIHPRLMKFPCLLFSGSFFLRQRGIVRLFVLVSCLAKDRRNSVQSHRRCGCLRLTRNLLQSFHEYSSCHALSLNLLRTPHLVCTVESLFHPSMSTLPTPSSRWLPSAPLFLP